MPDEETKTESEKVRDLLDEIRPLEELLLGQLAAGEDAVPTNEVLQTLYERLKEILVGEEHGPISE